MAARAESNIPLIVGSFGTSECGETLDRKMDTVVEAARDQGSSRASLCSTASRTKGP